MPLIDDSDAEVTTQARPASHAYRAPAASRASADPAPSPQQEAIIDGYRQELPVSVVVAYAGSGKTTTARQAMSASRDPAAYFVYTKEAADDARRKMPGHVMAGTVHSFAYGAPCMSDPGHASFGTLFGARLQKKGAELHEAIKTQFPTEISRVSYALGTTGKRPAVVEALNTVRSFCYSEDDHISKQHVPEKILAIVAQKLGQRAARDCVEPLVDLANKVWERMADPRAAAMPITHDIYLKMWQLQGPQLRQQRLVLDEAQDANPVMLNIVKQLVRSGTRVMLIGDPRQAIYQWRGAVNAMAEFPEAPHFALTTSWRYGQNIADTSQPLLCATLATDKLIGGGGEPGLVIDDEDAHFNPTAILCRSNAGVVEAAMDEISRGGRPYLAIKDKESTIKLIEAVYALSMGDYVWHPEIELFRRYDDLVEFSKTTEGGTVRPIISIVDRFSNDMSEVIENLRHNTALSATGASLVCSTIHSFKGMESDRVMLSHDVHHMSLIKEHKPTEPGKDSTFEISEANCNLAYVACTRARQALNTSGCQGLWRAELRTFARNPKSPQEMRAVQGAFEHQGLSLYRAYPYSAPSAPSSSDVDQQFQAELQRELRDQQRLVNHCLDPD